MRTSLCLVCKDMITLFFIRRRDLLESRSYHIVMHTRISHHRGVTNICEHVRRLAGEMQGEGVSREFPVVERI